MKAGADEIFLTDADVMLTKGRANWVLATIAAEIGIQSRIARSPTVKEL